MSEYQSLTKPTVEGAFNSSYEDSSNTPPHDENHEIKWWSLKLFSGSALIGALFLHFIYQIPSQFSFPIIVGQLMVISGAGLSLAHYFKLKKSSEDISRPNTLEHTFLLYKLIRHPMYFGDFIVYIGLFLLFPNLVSAFILAIGLIALVKQSMVEDVFAEHWFPEEFQKWKGKTKLIFPFVF